MTANLSYESQDFDVVHLVTVIHHSLDKTSTNHLFYHVSTSALRSTNLSNEYFVDDSRFDMLNGMITSGCRVEILGDTIILFCLDRNLHLDIEMRSSIRSTY